jgi:hypothetical protein
MFSTNTAEKTYYLAINRLHNKTDKTDKMGNCLVRPSSRLSCQEASKKNHVKTKEELAVSSPAVVKKIDFKPCKITRLPKKIYQNDYYSRLQSPSSSEDDAIPVVIRNRENSVESSISSQRTMSNVTRIENHTVSKSGSPNTPNTPNTLLTTLKIMNGKKVEQ